MEIMLLKESFKELEDALGILCAKLEHTHDAFAANSPGVFSTDRDALSLISSSLTNLYYPENAKDGRYTNVCIGAIGADSEILDLVRRVNLAKENFRKISGKVYQGLKSTKGKELSTSGRGRAMRSFLRDIGYGRVSLRLCNRRIPILSETPVSIRFSYSCGGRSIRKITVSKAIKMIEELGFDSVKAEIDKARLSLYPDDHIIAQVQDLAGYYKANVLYQDSLIPSTIPMFMPIFYPHRRDYEVKRQLRLPGVNDIQKRRERNDKKLEDMPLASSIRVFAYKN